jgi:hypothetical protein
MKFFFKLNVLFTGVLVLAAVGITHAQTYLYFQDSPDADYYDYSWMELTAPSELERKVEPDLRKFPVESVIPAQQGTNSLRLKWRSVSGGNWYAIAAGDHWEEKDLTDTDTLEFWLYSVEGIDAEDLPSVFMEDITNRKSIFLAVSDWSDDLSAGEWTRITIPMSNFLESGDGVDYTIIKTIGFAQNASDGIQHTLLIDNMRVNKGDGTWPPLEPPQQVSATAYECHIEVSWEHNEESYRFGYEIERSLNGGSDYFTLGQVDKDTRTYVDWVKELGATVAATYRVIAIGESDSLSEPSAAVSDTTHVMTDEELLDMVQRYTFRYFWDFAHEASGMARERNTSGNTVTSGGSGFGLMAIPVGIERGYISRQEGAERVLQILDFLSYADRFHGAWSHWINGNTGDVIPFSTYDNGGDIVETSYVAQGLLTIRQYFDGADEGEQQIVQLATDLWEEIEWDWYRRDGSPAIYWHWSPGYDWTMNMKVTGWNEAAIVYLLAIASPTYGVPASLWNTGWESGSNYINGKSFYGHKLYVGWDYGGPLFFAHYSFLGFDPRDKKDDNVYFFVQNMNHSLINQAYCEANPKGFEGYSAECWGLTASDDPDGYRAHEPYSSNDNGTITPTAALSSFPYTPEESMLALKHFYRNLGDRIWGWMGFTDAFNQQRNWYASSYLAIDQGPIVLMIENYRSQLLWDLFMSNPEIQPMMDSIGITYYPYSVKEISADNDLSVYPNPSASGFVIELKTDKTSQVQIDIYNMAGMKIECIIRSERVNPGEHIFRIDAENMEPGIYMARLILNNNDIKTVKLIRQ